MKVVTRFKVLLSQVRATLLQELSVTSCLSYLYSEICSLLEAPNVLFLQFIKRIAHYYVDVLSLILQIIYKAHRFASSFQFSAYFPL